MAFSRKYCCGPKTVVLCGCEGREIVITAGERGVRFLFITGTSLHEPIAWYGPIALNTQEELRVTFEEDAKGSFIKRR